MSTSNFALVIKGLLQCLFITIYYYFTRKSLDFLKFLGRIHYDEKTSQAREVFSSKKISESPEKVFSR